jgi:hypothetical protein
MAPRWPQVNNGPEHINEHATYLKEACNQLQAANEGRQGHVPWNIVHAYMESTITLIGKVLRQPAMSEILQHIQDSTKYIQENAKCTQNIQRDITVIKSSVGLSTTPLNSANFSGGRTTNPSWAQVAAQAKGSQLPPPPVSLDTQTSRSQPPVTAYKDRAVTVKLKDHGVAQRYRTNPAVWTRRQIETFVHNNPATKSVKIVAAHQLKSGDIQIYTSNAAEAIQLTENRGWTRGLGEQAELIVPTYGVIAHGISTKSINVKNHSATTQQILADNSTIIPNADIPYVGWLTKESPLKRASSIVLEFTDPEKANAMIYAGMAWDSQIHPCQLYDRSCRVKQCFRCYNYGHIGTQCSAPQTCGYCAEQHESKHCGQKGLEWFSPRCAVCKGVHTAWSNVCPDRKKELERVELAKQTRSVYWHVPPKAYTTQPRNHTTRNPDDEQIDRTDTITVPTRTVVQRMAEAIERTRPSRTNAAIASEPQTAAPINQITAPSAAQEPLQLETAPGEQVPSEEIPTRVSLAPTVENEDWATPTEHGDYTQEQDIPIDPQIQTAEDLHPTYTTLETGQTQPYEYPLDGIDGTAAIQEADAWLEDLANEWIQAPAEIAPSPPTSMATDPRVAQGNIFRGCKCPSHREIYDGWPVQDAELVIARCMSICTYCGKDFGKAPSLREHLKGKTYVQRNLTIRLEKGGPGKGTIPGWVPRRSNEASQQARREPQPTDSRVTRSQSNTNGTNATPCQ